MDKKTEIKSFTEDENSIEYFTFGNGEKDLIILPGLSALPIKNSENYIIQRYKPLTDNYRITLIDRPLHPQTDYSMTKAANEVFEIIQSLNAKKVSIMGFSLGGMIAQTVAINYPEIVEKLILCATTSIISEITKDKISSWIDAAENSEMGKLANLFVNDIYSQQTAKAIEINTRKLLSTITKELLNRFIILAKSSCDFDVQKEISKIKCKTLIMASKGDKIIPLDDIKFLYQSIKNSQLYVYDDNYGHAFIDEADDVIERINNFLKNN